LGNAGRGETVERWRNVTARICGIIAAACLAAMMLLTVADVVLRAAFNTPIRGVYELVELLLAYTFFMALPAVFLRDENIVVNSIDDLAPRAVPALKRIGLALAVVVLALIGWQGFIAARDTIAFNDVTADLGLSRGLHWIALLVGVIGAAIAALAMCLRRNVSR
jgi:TRAP-type C4-dicarboxylate transport system permease small subunit